MPYIICTDTRAPLYIHCKAPTLQPLHPYTIRYTLAQPPYHWHLTCPQTLSLECAESPSECDLHVAAKIVGPDGHFYMVEGRGEGGQRERGKAM